MLHPKQSLLLEELVRFGSPSVAAEESAPLSYQGQRKKRKCQAPLCVPNNSICLSEQMSSECKKYTVWILTLPLQKTTVRNGVDHIVKRHHKPSCAGISRSTATVSIQTLGHRSAKFYIAAAVTPLFVLLIMPFLS